MNQFIRIVILFTLLFITACNVNVTDEQQELRQRILPELDYSFIDKKFPVIFRFEPDADLNVNAESAILIDATNGRVLFDKNSQQSLAVASMSKIMSELLVLEAIDDGIIDWEDTVAISDYAYTISHQPGYSSIELEQNKPYSVRELFHAVAISSANGATIALAEKIAGTEMEFVMLMNEKAEMLELHNSSFVNSTGLSNYDLLDHHSTGSVDDYNQMSATDLATLTKYSIDEHPELLDVTSLTEFDVEKETHNNSNWMLPAANKNFTGLDVTYPGVDGLKTGFTKEAGYGFTGTVLIEDVRLISVVIGAEVVEDRFLETGKLYDTVSKRMYK